MKWGIGIALLLLATVVAAVAWYRTREAREFSQPHRVRTYGGTNYVVRLTATTVGRAHTNHLLILTVRLENPNPFEVLLHRNWFVLMDHDRDYYLPSTNGTQTALIRLPPGGVVEREQFSYVVPDDSFHGVLAWLAGHQHFVLVKSDRPYPSHLRDGEFVTFHRRNW